jgi:Xaa-Pro aminopeptidase
VDTSFIQRPHHYLPRRNLSTSAVDWQERVNFERLRKERLNRARNMMKEKGLGALILFVGENVRYVTGAFQGNWKNNIFVRYAVLPGDGEPVLFETVGADLECAKLDLPWMEGRLRPAITWKWSEGAEEAQAKRMAASIKEALAEHHVDKERIGIDIMDMQAYLALTGAGLKIENAWPAMSAARVVKTPDELELLKISSSIGDAAFWRIQHEWLKPGVTEREVMAKVNEFLYNRGCEIVYEVIVAAGGNTSPYRRWPTDRIIRFGDLVIIDINAVGPSGYFMDFVRCFKVGGKPTPQEKELYKRSYNSLYEAIGQVRPGATTRDVAEKFPVYDDDKYGSASLFQFAHSIGLSLYEGMWISRAYSLQYPAEIKPNMYFAIETYASQPGAPQSVRLEQNLVVTDTGHEIFTLYPFEDDMLS